MERKDLEKRDGEELSSAIKKPYVKPEVKKYPVIQQTTGYVIYYYGYAS